MNPLNDMVSEQDALASGKGWRKVSRLGLGNVALAANDLAQFAFSGCVQPPTPLHGEQKQQAAQLRAFKAHGHGSVIRSLASLNFW